MNNGNGLSRGDRNRNARLNRLRALVPTGNAFVGIDLADRKQMVVITDHDSKVLARRTSCPYGLHGGHLLRHHALHGGAACRSDRAGQNAGSAWPSNSVAAQRVRCGWRSGSPRRAPKCSIGWRREPGRGPLAELTAVRDTTRWQPGATIRRCAARTRTGPVPTRISERIRS